MYISLCVGKISGIEQGLKKFGYILLNSMKNK